ncbi:hypothetical protein [Vannielia litorea]|uniref:Uncharacterized protein n=1 Tax=Vannielia litorea TaxID=1217970 RepID=A0A1N6H518_9RHOB|nr:hypothetical protein [Vannielia litorea]SIO14890.1 hypothetical protein SAMN05444002_3087 [Vannielia litorea]
MPDSKNRFVPLPPQAQIDPLEELPAVKEEPKKAPKGVFGRCVDRICAACTEVIRGLMPYIIVSAVLLVAIAVFFGVSSQAAIILLGLGAVALGVFVAATQGQE